MGIGQPDARSIALDSDRAVREFFPPELFNRIDRIVHFSPLSRESGEKVVEKELARLLAPIASEAETLSLPPDPAQRATEILARPDGPRPASSLARWRGRRTATIAALVAAAIAGLAVALSGGGGHTSQPANSTPRTVAPPAKGTNVADQAHNLAHCLRQHSG